MIIITAVEVDVSNNYPEYFQLQNLGLSVLEDTTEFTYITKASTHIK